MEPREGTCADSVLMWDGSTSVVVLNYSNRRMFKLAVKGRDERARGPDVLGGDYKSVDRYIEFRPVALCTACIYATRTRTFYSPSCQPIVLRGRSSAYAIIVSCDHQPGGPTTGRQ